MSWSVNLAGTVFTEANVEGTAYADEETGFPAILAAIAEETRFLKGIGATSATSHAPSIGTKVFTTDQTSDQVTVPAGALVQVRSAGDQAAYMIGSVVSFSGATLVVQVSIANGDSRSDWVIAYPDSRLTDLVQDLYVNGRAIRSRDNGNISILPHGSGVSTVHNLKATGVMQFLGPGTIYGETVLMKGSSHAEFDLGTHSGAVDVHWYFADFMRIALDGDATLECWASSAGLGYGKVVRVLQDATGGRTLNVTRKSNGAAAIWLTEPVVWADRPAGAWDYLSVLHTPAGDLFVGFIAGSD